MYVLSGGGGDLVWMMKRGGEEGEECVGVGVGGWVGGMYRVSEGGVWGWGCGLRGGLRDAVL